MDFPPKPCINRGSVRDIKPLDVTDSNKFMMVTPADALGGTREAICVMLSFAPGAWRQQEGKMDTGVGVGVGQLKHLKMSWNPPGIVGPHAGLSLPPRLQLAWCQGAITEAGTCVTELPRISSRRQEGERKTQREVELWRVWRLLPR